MNLKIVSNFDKVFKAYLNRVKISDDQKRKELMISYRSKMYVRYRMTKNIQIKVWANRKKKMLLFNWVRLAKQHHAI